MKKKFSLDIKNPCDANVNQMTPNAAGFFCDSCAKNVIDLSKKNTFEIAQFIKENQQSNICARLKTNQLNEVFEINEISKSNNFKYAVAVAASVLLTSTINAQEKEPVKTEINCPKPNPHILGKVVFNQQIEKIILVTLTGKILDVNTKKPLDASLYPNLKLMINGSEKEVTVNPKTGAYSIELFIPEKRKEIYINLYNNDNHYSKLVPVDLKQCKQSVLHQNIYVNPTEISKLYIAGGLGVNYIQENKTLKS